MPVLVPDLFDQAFDHAAIDESAARSLLRRAPDDPDGRARALGYYMRREGERWSEPVPTLVVWFVRHHPNDLVCVLPAFMSSAEAPTLTTQLAGLWRQHEANGQLSFQGLQNAATFFSCRDWREAERLLLAAREFGVEVSDLDIGLGKLRASLAQKGDALQREHALAAVRYLEPLAESEGTADEDERLYARQILAEVALLAGDKGSARRYAERLLQEESPRQPAHHIAHTVLGRLAHAEGDLEKARQALLAAAATPRDYVSSSYGPRLALAKLLHAEGESEVVIVYLRKRAETWDCCEGRSAKWIEAMQAGRAPDWDAYRDHI